MINQDERQNVQKIDKLAQDVLLLSRNTLLVNLRFLDMALSQLEYVPNTLVSPVGTDGEHLVYDSRKLLLKYKNEKEEMTRCYFHMVLHCVFRHMYIHSLVIQRLWNLSCDIAVEAIINELGIRSTETSRCRLQSPIIIDLKNKVKYLTAEKIYNYLLNNSVNENTLEKWEELFVQDNHILWYLPKEQQLEIIVTAGSGNSSEGNEESLDKGQDGTDSQGEEGNSFSAEGSSFMEQQWKDISERMQQDLETFSKQRGDIAGNLMQNLTALNREKYDYESFLKKFAILGEKMRINDDEFDYIFYTYGLSLYRNMPLIEPLEFKEVKSIREFVIAIDTSGSVQGRQVQSFINKTYNIMKSTESFFTRINVHIIQCDSVIQEDVKITNQHEFDNYIKSMTLKGFGGTDFRPVFDHVDQMIKAGEFSNLKGLIYFTDGYGTFPSRKPDYETAFVFVRDNYEIPNVPSWAIKLVLEPEEL